MEVGLGKFFLLIFKSLLEPWTTYRFKYKSFIFDTFVPLFYNTTRIQHYVFSFFAYSQENKRKKYFIKERCWNGDYVHNRLYFELMNF